MTAPKTAMYDTLPSRRGAAALVLMLKAPERSKRRMAAQIGALATAAARHLTDCALEDAATWPGPVCYAVAAEPDRRWLVQYLDGTRSMLVQRGGNLGERINHVDAELRQRGFERLLYIGSDCPLLEPTYLDAAAAALYTHDVVLAPARDGGVVAMGASRPWPDLAPLPWSSPRLCDALAALCRASGLRIATLATRSDVDTVADLLESAATLALDPRPARQRLTRWLSAFRDALERTR